MGQAEIAQRVVVVTGAAEGIGWGIARRFALAGYPTAMLDIQADRLEQAAQTLRDEGCRVVSHVVDASDRAQIEAAYAKIREELGPISIVVPNAGIANFIPFMSMTTEQWDQMIRINLSGVFHTIQAAVPDMIAGGWGRIITISSHAGQSGSPMQVHYTSAKSGVIGMTKALARELAAHGITVNSIPPSLVETPQMHRTKATGEFPVDMIVQMIPISRPGQPEEIGGACLFLASDDASYITGQLLGVNGGMHM